MEEVFKSLAYVEEVVEYALSGYTPWQLMAGTLAITLGIRALFQANARQDALTSLKKRAFQVIRSIPVIRRHIELKLKETKKDALQTMFSDDGDADRLPILTLPLQGSSSEKVLADAKALLRQGKYDWANGKISGASFCGNNDTYSNLLLQVFHLTSWSNPLHADVFPGVRKMQAEVVAMMVQVFRGDKAACGCMTSGGTESLVMAVKTARDWSRATKGITQPEIVAGFDVHAGVDKAAHMMGLRLRKVAMNPKTRQTDVHAMKAAMTCNTVLLVASAPNYPHGIVDDVVSIAALGHSRSVPVHVDSCMGGMLLPFMGAAGFPLEPFDFTVEGVTSISADTHKYGNAHKGSSVILYRSKEYRHYQYFVTPSWPGGLYATHTIPGSRSGGLLAVCWAALMYHGYEGYTTITKDIITVARKVKQGFSEIPGLFLFGEPLTSIIAVGSDTLNIYTVVDMMAKRGWHLAALQYPPGMHICLTSLHTKPGIVETLIRDMKEVVKEVKAGKGDAIGGVGRAYGMAASIPDVSLVGEAALNVLEAYYATAVDFEK